MLTRANVSVTVVTASAAPAGKVFVSNSHDSGRGYFRDPYNSWDLLWQFRLSWWTDVIPMLDAERYLSVEKAAALLTMLKEREPVFEENLRALKAPDAQYFREQYRSFREFLDEAIRLNEAVECSL